MLEECRGAITSVLGKRCSEEKTIYCLLHIMSVWGRCAEQFRQIQALPVDSWKPNAVCHGLTGWAFAQLFLDSVQPFWEKSECSGPQPKFSSDQNTQLTHEWRIPLWVSARIIALSFTPTSRSARGPPAMIDCFWALGSSLPSYPSSSARTKKWINFNQMPKEFSAGQFEELCLILKLLCCNDYTEPEWSFVVET